MRDSNFRFLEAWRREPYVAKAMQGRPSPPRLWLPRKSTGFAFHFIAQAGAHEFAQFIDDRIGDQAEGAQSFLAHRDHACFAQDGEVLGYVRLTGTGGFDELADGLFTSHEQIQKAQAHGF